MRTLKKKKKKAARTLFGLNAAWWVAHLLNIDTRLQGDPECPINKWADSLGVLGEQVRAENGQLTSWYSTVQRCRCFASNYYGKSCIAQTALVPTIPQVHRKMQTTCKKKPPGHGLTGDGKAGVSRLLSTAPARFSTPCIVHVFGSLRETTFSIGFARSQCTHDKLAARTLWITSRVPTVKRVQLRDHGPGSSSPLDGKLPAWY